LETIHDQSNPLTLKQAYDQSKVRKDGEIKFKKEMETNEKKNLVAQIQSLPNQLENRTQQVNSHFGHKL
jgi:hypothetical protein